MHYSIEELIKQLLDSGYYCLSGDNKTRQIYSCRSILIELFYNYSYGDQYRIFDKISGVELKNGRFFDGESFKKYTLDTLIGSKTLLINNGLNGLDNNQLINMYDNSLLEFNDILKKDSIFKYFIEVYMFYEYKSELAYRRVGKDDYFDDTTTKKYIVRFLNNFIHYEKIEKLLPAEEIEYERSTGYGGGSSRDVKLTFDLEKTKYIIDSL